MRASIERAQRRSAALRAAILERVFSDELVSQDTDERSEGLLARIRAERDPSTRRTHGRKPPTSRAE